MVKQVQVNGDQVIVGAKAGHALVASTSQPGFWHVVSDGHCDCIGFAHRGNCRHVRAVALLAETPVSLAPNKTFELVELMRAGAFRPA